MRKSSDRRHRSCALISIAITRELRLMSSRPSMETQHSQKFYLEEMPAELLDIIFGMLNITDLPKLKRVSKWMQVFYPWCQAITKRRLFLVPCILSKWTLSGILLFTLWYVFAVVWKGIKLPLIRCWKPSSVHLLRYITWQDFIIESRCGEHGWFLIWFNDPPKRLCRRCLDLDRYQCTVLEEASKHFELTNEDIINIPTISGTSWGVGSHRHF
jgi:hypothetical protein